VISVTPARCAGFVDEQDFVITAFFTALDSWVNLNLVETRTFPVGVVLTRHETRR
jgi:hypothetical protein